MEPSTLLPTYTQRHSADNALVPNARFRISELLTLRDTADTVNLMASESDAGGTSHIELVGISRDPSGLILLFFIFVLNFCRGLKALAAEYMHIHKYIYIYMYYLFRMFC